jgi:hypothetical protein
MKGMRRLLLGIAIVFSVLAVMGVHRVALAQSKQAPQWMLDEAKLPPDIHPDTLSRMPRPKESDYATDEEKQLFNRVMHRNPTQSLMRWLGPTGTRVAIPQLAAAGGGEGAGDQALEPKYRELTVAAVNRELGNREEFINHEIDAVKAYGMDLEMDIINRKDTKGMDPKAAVIIEFARDLFKYPRTASVSSKAFADLEKTFGRKGALVVASIACSYDMNFLEMRAYDQHMDTNSDCLPGGHHGCLDLNNPPPAWEVPTSWKPTKEEKESDWVAEQSKLPADVHPDTLSRMPRPQESNFSNDKEKEIFNQVMHRNPTQATMRWLGPTGTRVTIPEYAAGTDRISQAIHAGGGVDNKYMELVVAVATRETGNRSEFLNHEDDAIKAYGKDLEEVVRLRKDTKGVDPKAASIIEFGRDIFKLPRIEAASSKHFADLESNFGKRGALSIIALMAYYESNYTLMRVYDQHMDTNSDCLPGGHHGCLDVKNPPPTW